MVALFTEFLAVLQLLIDFVVAILVPADVASITPVHIAIWIPIVISIAGLIISFYRKTWGGNRR